MNKVPHDPSLKIAYPAPFLDEMSRLLGEEYPEFIASLDEPSIIGLRVNSLKLSPDEFETRSPFTLSPVPWCPTGFTLDNDEGQAIDSQPGKHIFHSAGLYYLQEPSAMVAAELLDPQPGEKVLDLAAAPGGKATHLAALMKNSGLLVANEIHPRRVWDLAENLERLGVTNAIVLNEPPQNLATNLGEFFDRVLLDAPCSGEGMFRKSELARKEWKPELSKSCAFRQLSILEQAGYMLKPGGHLLYTTCTFSPLENELVITKFLDSHPNFEIVPVNLSPGLESARPEWINQSPNHRISKAIRIWPHRTNAEGHFAALLTKKCTSYSHLKQTSRNNKDTSRKPKRTKQIDKVRELFETYSQENLVFTNDTEQIRLEGSYVYLQPADSPALENLRVIHPGWWLGSIQSDRFKPSHAFAMGIRIDQARHTLILLDGDERITKYLAGESIHAEGENGWVLVTVEGYPLGWGKRVNQIVKNYYPKGLRH